MLGQQPGVGVRPRGKGLRETVVQVPPFARQQVSVGHLPDQRVAEGIAMGLRARIATSSRRHVCRSVNLGRPVYQITRAARPATEGTFGGVAGLLAPISHRPSVRTETINDRRPHRGPNDQDRRDGALNGSGSRRRTAQET